MTYRQNPRVEEVPDDFYIDESALALEPKRAGVLGAFASNVLAGLDLFYQNFYTLIRYGALPLLLLYGVYNYVSPTGTPLHLIHCFLPDTKAGMVDCPSRRTPHADRYCGEFPRDLFSPHLR